MDRIEITSENAKYAFCELDWTHDYSDVVEGSVLIDRDGRIWVVTKIDEDDYGRRRFWSNEDLLTRQYTSPHNMLTKSPFYAFRYKTS